MRLLPCRRRVVAGMLGLVLLVAGRDAGADGDRCGSAAVREVEEIAITVEDLERSVGFYTRVLGFRVLSTEEREGTELETQTGVFGARVRSARLRLGDETIRLVDFLTPRGRPYPWDTTANDAWFQHLAIVVSDMDAAYALLRRHHVEYASTSPQTLPPSIPAAAGVRAFYFRDPDGHFLELLQFPRGKGPARWHANPRGLFLGIDHTAIVVADTERALALYRDTLGMQVVGASDNAGSEQEHLNNVEGARLHITTLRTAAGPGIELLEYRSPRSGRLARPDLRANDLAHLHVRLVLCREVPLSAFARVVSRGGRGEAAGEDAAGRETLVRDADGHGLELVPPPATARR